MKGQATIFAISCCALQLVNEGEAFAALPSLLQQKTASSLNLVPDQGNQLVAAYNANCLLEQQEQASAPALIQVDTNVEVPHRGAIAASKSFLTRIFHMPSILHPGEKKNEDVVYYPMVGFRFFKGIDNVFPTTWHVSCDIPTKEQKEEEVYGWFSSSCKLNLFSEDVCRNPIGSEPMQ